MSKRIILYLSLLQFVMTSSCTIMPRVHKATKKDFFLHNYNDSVTRAIIIFEYSNSKNYPEQYEEMIYSLAKEFEDKKYLIVIKRENVNNDIKCYDTGGYESIGSISPSGQIYISTFPSISCDELKYYTKIDILFFNNPNLRIDTLDPKDYIQTEKIRNIYELGKRDAHPIKIKWPEDIKKEQEEEDYLKMYKQE